MNSSGPKTFSLDIKTKLALVVLLLFTVSIWVLTVAVGQRLEQGMVTLLKDQQMSSLFYVVEDIQENINQRIELLDANALLITPELIADPDKAREFLKSRVGLHSFFKAGLVLISKEGRGLADYPQIPERARSAYNDLEYFQEVIATGKTAIGKARIGRFTKKPGVAIAAPIKDKNGQLTAMLVGFATLSDASLFGVIEKAKVGITGWLVVSDPKHGIIVSSSVPSLILQPLSSPQTGKIADKFVAGSKSAGISLNSDGIEILSSTGRIPSTGWIVQISLPTKEAFAPIREMQSRMYVIAALLTLFSALVVWMVIRHMLKPLGNAAELINDMAAGRKQLQQVPAADYNEIGDLLASFNTLVEMRKRAEDSLQQRNEQIEAILKATTESIFQVDREGIILVVNETAAHRLQKEPKDLIGKCIFDLFPPDVAAEWRASMSEVLRTGKAKIVEDVRGDRLFSLNYYPVSGKDGKADSMVVFALDITERKLNQQRMELLLAEQKAMLENDLIGIVTVRNRTIIWANPAFEKMLGYARGELVGKPTRQNFPSEEAYLAFGAAAYPVLAGENVYRSQIEFVRKDGKRIWVDVSGGMQDGESGESLWGFVDITERRMLEQSIAQSEQRMELALAGADLGLWDLDIPSGRFTHNPRLVTMVGYESDEIDLNANRFISLLHPDDASRFGTIFYAHLKGETPSFEVEYRVRHKDGHWVWILSRGKVVARDENGRAVRMTGTNLDITERKANEAKINDLAFYDPLTNLPNRRLLLDRLGLALPASARRNTCGAILFLDLDNFKILNDSKGHEFGDLLLTEVARRLLACVRSEDTVARQGGDEFVVMLEDLSAEAQPAAAQAETIAEKIRSALGVEYSLQGYRHQCTASIGICLFKGTEVKVGELLKRADIAMYQAKSAGRNSIRFFRAG